LINPGPIESLDRFRNRSDLPFRLTIIGNRPGGTARLAAYTREPGANVEQQTDLDLEWPRGVFSLGHVALPFPPDDPVYGLDPKPGPGPAFHLGMVAPRGESGALLVPLGTFARLRCNPFFEVVRARVVASLETKP
jgi:hypothetical protein